MATKVGGIILFENKYLIFNVGDMRVYESRNGVLSLKTANLFLNEGEHRKIYFSDCIGGDGLVCNTNIIRGTISEDERLFLICGDGICSQLDHDKVCSILKKNENLENKKRAIIQETKKNGSLDNESFVLIRFVK